MRKLLLAALVCLGFAVVAPQTTNAAPIGPAVTLASEAAPALVEKTYWRRGYYRRRFYRPRYYYRPRFYRPRFYGRRYYAPRRFYRPRYYRRRFFY